MLPRQRRAGVATDGARRERMRPWQRPERDYRPRRRVRRPRASFPAATELRIPCVASPVRTASTTPIRPRCALSPGPPTECPRTCRPNLIRPATFGHSRSALEPDHQKSPTAFIRFSALLLHAASTPRRTRSRTAADRLKTLERFGRAAGPPAPTPGPPFTRTPTRTHAPSSTPARRTARRTVRETRLASRTGPPPAGNEAAVSPSPQCPVQRADPRSTHGSAPVRTGPERTAGRTATHEEHAGTPGTGLSQGSARGCEPWLSAPPGTRIRPGQRVDKGRGPQARARSERSVRAVLALPVRAAPALPVRALSAPPPSGPPPSPLSPSPPSPRFPSAPPSRLLPRPPATSVTRATHTAGASWLTAVRLCSPSLAAAGRRSTRFATRRLRADNNPAIRTSAP